MIPELTRRLIRDRLAAETGRLDKDAPFRVALVYPSPYTVAMSSLGYQRIYAAIQGIPDISCERVFLEDEGDRPGAELAVPVSYEGLRVLSEFPVLAVSVAYEGELAGLVRLLDAAGISPVREQRTARDPLIIAGGPLTFSNPLPLAGLVDAIVMGEAEEVSEWLFGTLRDASSRTSALERLAEHPNLFVPAIHGEKLPPIARCDDRFLPAVSVIRTPNTELANMLLIEAERGCSRSCAYCVMRRSATGGMRLVPRDTVLAKIPPEVRRVGLVGAAVSDHPDIVEIVNTLAERGCEVGLSSLRPERLSDDMVAALVRVGYRTLTTALDGPSERLRGLVERRGREAHYQNAAERARKHGMNRLKLYLIVGLPSETDEDIDECVRFVGELTRIVPIALGVAPFCSKRNTPLDRQPFAGVSLVESRMARLRKGLRGRADIRAISAKWAWIEHVLAQGGPAEGLAVVDAVRRGGQFAHFRAAFGALGHDLGTPRGNQ